jgi:hypothetical protein
MKVKIFSDDLQNDSTVKKLKKHYDKKQKDFENIETRLNEFISDKKVIEIKSYVTEAFFSEPKITFVVYYSE